ncbi:ribonuclease H-like domain-containing protein, partial [Tanacetum coccineum]
YKACLVANGNSQQLCVNYDDTFSPIVKPATIRTVLSLAASRNSLVHQLDVKNAFLHASSTSFLHRIIASLHHEFFMTDLGPLNYFLGIFVIRSTNGMFLSQKTYAADILERAGMRNCHSCRTSIDTESKLRAHGTLVSDLTLNKNLAGALQYLTLTRHDLSYVVQQVCHHMHDPREPHLASLKRVLRYVA